MGKILIWIPTLSDKIDIKFHGVLKNLIIPEGYTVDESYVVRTYIDRARNIIVDKAIKWNYDYLFFLDDDIYPNKDILVNLVSTNLDIVSGVYKERADKQRLVVYDDIWNWINRNKINIALWTIQRAFAVWAWCLLIKVDMLKEMRAKYWYNVFKMWELYEYKREEFMFDMDIDYKLLKKRYFSEDISFCYRASSLWYKTHIDTRCLCGHLWEYWMIRLTSSDFCTNSKPLISVITKSNYSGLAKCLKNNFESTVITWNITKDIVKSAKWKYIMFMDNVNISYWLDELMIQWLEEVDIEWPLLMHNGKVIFRNDNIVNNCWMMKKEELLKYLPISTNIPDFTLYRKLKENDRLCGIVEWTADLLA